jgi:hypothetical protein
VGRRRPPVPHLGAGVVGHRDPAGRRRPADRMSHSSEGAAPAERRATSSASRGCSMPFVSLVRGPADQQRPARQDHHRRAGHRPGGPTSLVTVWIDLGNAAPYSGGWVQLARRCSRRELDVLLTTAPRGTHGRPCHAAECRRRSAAGRVFAGSHDPQRGSARGCQGSYALCRRPACPGRHRRTPPHRLPRWSFSR